MRTGLVAVGTAMALVGAGVIAVAVLPFSAAGESRIDKTWESPVAANSLTFHDLPSDGVGSAAVTFIWNSSAAVQVTWFSAGACPDSPGWCVLGKLAYWSSNTSGQWTSTGSLDTDYRVIVDDPGDAGLNFTSEFVESYPAPAHHLPLVPFALVVSGGSFLVGIGGLAIYLGVFLPSNVYGAPPPEEDDPSPDELEPNH